MGCGASKWKDPGVVRRGRPRSVGEVVVFLPGLRVPRTVDFPQSLGDHLDTSTVERLSALRATVVTMAMQESAMALKPRRRTTRHGGSGTANLLQALEEYLPVLLGLVKESSDLRNKVQFVWANQEDDSEETSMADAWYEVLSVLHLMAMVCFLQANSLLLPRSYGDGQGPRVSEVNQVLPQIPPEKRFNSWLYQFMNLNEPKFRMTSTELFDLNFRRALPVDLVEGNLKALSLQGLGQGVDMQLGLAIDNPKATLAVKRRLACEMVKYWQQIKDSIPELPLSDGWAKKHTLFVKWKYAEAKAAAYYFHGLILDEGNTEKSQEMAISSLQASEEFLKESKRASKAFHSTPPTSRISTPFGTTKHLLDMIPKETLSKLQNNQDLNTQERPSNTGVSQIITPPPPLPDFPLALNPEEYELPQLDPLLKKEANH
uniref:Uncharacterized protein n=1 Tax=Aegilops tauschii TaxID=37682 RepID=M8CD20_AEGTA